MARQMRQFPQGKYVLRTPHVTQDGQVYAVYMYYYWKGKQIRRSVDFFVSQKDWNQDANGGVGEFRPSYGPNYKERNAYLKELMYDIDSKIMDYLKKEVLDVGLTMIEIREATKNQAPEIASLIMMAMTDDCCLYFCGDGYGLEDLTSGRACSRSAEQASLLRSRLLADFRKMMMMLVEREDSQYSYKNTLVALDGENVVGISVSYDGGKLHQLRHAFIESAKEYIGKDHSGMDDETQAGELYLDSLAVLPEYRRRCIAKRLIEATKDKADSMGLPCVGLLVDKGNPSGEALYSSVGFRYANDNMWGGHPMKHLTL